VIFRVRATFITYRGTFYPVLMTVVFYLESGLESGNIISQSF